MLQSHCPVVAANGRADRTSLFEARRRGESVQRGDTARTDGGRCTWTDPQTGVGSGSDAGHHRTRSR